jgi:hypothetical protein
VVSLTDAWAVRELTICVRNMKDLPLYARQLVEHLRSSNVRDRHAGVAKSERADRRSNPANRHRAARN